MYLNAEIYLRRESSASKLKSMIENMETVYMTDNEVTNDFAAVLEKSAKA
jgi:hypothetical protein